LDGFVKWPISALCGALVSAAYLVYASFQKNKKGGALSAAFWFF